MITEYNLTLNDKTHKVKICLSDSSMLGKNLNDVSTWKWMMQQNMSIAIQALQWAAFNGNIEIVKFLFSLPNVKFSEDTCCSAIMASSEKGHADIVMYLLSLSKTKFILSWFGFDMSMRNTIVIGDLDVVKLLISTFPYKDDEFTHHSNMIFFKTCLAENKLDIFKYLASKKQVVLPDSAYEKYPFVEYNDDSMELTADTIKYLESIKDSVIIEYSN